MPRNITVTFADGKTHVYQNAPDDLTPEQVTQRVQSEFPGVEIASLDGGRQPTTQVPPEQRQRAEATPAPRERPQGTLSARGYSLPNFGRPGQTVIPSDIGALSQSEAAQRVQRGEDRLREITMDMPNETRRLAYEKFYGRPRVQAYRAQAGLSETPTRDETIRRAATRSAARDSRNVARTVRAAQSLVPEGIPEPIRNFLAPVTMLDAEDTGDFLTAAKAGLSRGAFGLPERAIAGLEYAFGDSGQSYDNILQVQRAQTDAELDRSLAGNITGQGTSAVLSGSAIMNGVRQGGARLAASQTPRIAQAGRAIDGATRMRQGERAMNAAKTVYAGAAFGGAQAAGEGSDITTGAVIGGLAPLGLGAAAKTLQTVGRAGRTLTRPMSQNVNAAIREVVTENPSAIRARQAELSRRTGGNVSLIAALRDKDFGAVTTRILQRSDEAIEVAKRHTTSYMRTFMDRMTGHVNQAGRTGGAMQASIGDLAQLRKDTADDLMRPIQDQRVNIVTLPLDDLERSLVREIGGRDRNLASRLREALSDDDGGLADEFPDMSPDDLRAAARMLDEWGLGKNVSATVRELDALRRSLDAAGQATRTSQPANSLAFRNAARVIREHVEESVPAYGQMVDTFAAQSRLIEGFEAAAAGRRVGETADDTLRANMRTPEGVLGRKAGELFRLREAAGNRTSGAVGLAREAASGGRLTRPAAMEGDAALPGTVTENLGDPASRGLRESSQAEYSVLERMLASGKIKLTDLDDEALDNPGTIAYGATLLGGNAQAQTIARFVANLVRKVGSINSTTAGNVAELLFSRDPAKTAQALRALERAGMSQQAVAAMMRQSFPRGTIAGQLAGGATVDDAAPEPERQRVQSTSQTPAMPSDMTPADSMGDSYDYAPSDEGYANPSGYVPNQGVPNPDSTYAAPLSQIYATESPEFLALIERQFQQESGNRQFDDNGRPITSSAGAIGIAQVMPATAPEAARMAGVPFDEEAYRTDASYNKLIGIAYMSNMLRRYDGDVRKALAAYNAGPGRVDRALQRNPRNWLSTMPAETKDYVQKLA